MGHEHIQDHQIDARSLFLVDGDCIRTIFGGDNAVSRFFQGSNYHSLNLRADRRFFFNRSNIVLYLSIWNVYGRENISGYSWNGYTNEKSPIRQWSTLPILGVEYEF